MVINIPGKLPGLNDVISANRSNKYVGAKLKKKTEQLLCTYIKSQCKRKYERVRIAIAWYEPNKRRDFDNICSGKKFILDALVKSGVIPNDGWKQIDPIFVETFLLDKENPRIEILLIDANDTNEVIKRNTMMIKELTKENEQLFVKREIERNKDQISIEELNL